MNSQQQKYLGIWSCSALVVGNMVGSGIFLLPASLAPYGGVSIIGWIVTALGALMTALVFIRLSRRFPKQGGPYRYAFDNFGSLAGFTVAWSYWVSIWCGNAAISVASVAYLSFFFPQIQEDSVLAIGVALTIIWVITAINLKGVKEAGLFQLLTVMLKLIPLFAIGIAAFFIFDSRSFKPFNPSEHSLTTSITTTAALTLWAFLGLESATIPADNVDRPGVTIPRATLIGFLIVAGVYISSQVAIISVVPSDALRVSEAPFADAAKLIWGEWAGYMVAAGAVVSCLGALNGWILLQGQVPMTAARDGLFPKIFVDKDNSGLSRYALVFSSLLISILVVANYSGSMVSLFTFAILVSTLGIFMPYLLSILVEIKYLLISRSNYFALLLSVLALTYCVWAISGIGSKAMVWGTVLILAGLPLYLFMRFKYSA